MKTIIAGSRTITDWTALAAAIEACPWEITAVVSGGASGVDRLGEEFADETELPLEVYPARWDAHGSSAGRLRNELMLGKANHVLAVWDGQSYGTRHMINIAKRDGAEVFVYELPFGDTGAEPQIEHFPARVRAGGSDD